MLTGPYHLVVLYVPHDGTQYNRLHNLPQHWGQTDLPQPATQSPTQLAPAGQIEPYTVCLGKTARALDQLPWPARALHHLSQLASQSWTEEMVVWMNPWSVNHSFLLLGLAPENLVGKHLLHKLQAELQCTPQGITLWLLMDNMPRNHDSYSNWGRYRNTPGTQDAPRILWAQGSVDVGFRSLIQYR